MQTPKAEPITLQAERWPAAEPRTEPTPAITLIDYLESGAIAIREHRTRHSADLITLAWTWLNHAQQHQENRIAALIDFSQEKAAQADKELAQAAQDARIPDPRD